MTRRYLSSPSKAPGSVWASLSLFSLVVLLLAASAAHAAAQAVYGSVRGTITDASGGVLPGVNVTITSKDRNTSDTVVTDSAGVYRKERLLPGVYEVKADLQGFKQAVLSNVVIGVDAQANADFSLSPGAVTESVEVVATSPLLKTDRADVSTRFDTKELTELPVLDRNFTKFILLTPGAQQLGWQHAPSENPQGSTQTQVNGQHFSGTGYQLDGTENRDPILGIIVINPNLESIGETKITSQNYDAEFGQATAGVVSVQTKSGANTLRGSGFEFFQNESLQARNPFTQARPDPTTGKFIPDSKRNQFGGSAGGPIIQNKWFFFGDYQGTRNDRGGSVLASVPTVLARAGNLSEYGQRIFNPATGQEFGNATIPQGQLSPQALNILQLIPVPNAPGRENGTRDNFTASGVENFTQNSTNVRIDGRLGQAINNFGRYSIGKFHREAPSAFGPGGGPSVIGGGNLGGVSESRNQSLAYGVDYPISSTLLADLRFGWFQYKVDVLPGDFGTTPAADAGIPNLNKDTNFTSGLPYFALRGNQADMDWGWSLNDNAGRCNCPLNQNEKQWQVVSNITKLWGSHTSKFGVDIRRAYNLRIPSDQHRSGQLTFSALRTSNAGQGGLGLATFLLGDVSNGTGEAFGRYVSTSLNARERQWRHFYYAQDTWRTNSKLTLNYGLRLDVINPQTVNEARNGTWVDLTTGRGLVGGVGGIDLSGNTENRLNWAPRVGGTYQVNEKTVIRSGYGRTYDIGVFGSLFGHTVTQNLPVLAAQSLTAPSQFDRVFNLAQGPPDPSFVEPGADGTFTWPDGVKPLVLPRKQRPPAVDAWNVTVQRQLSSTTSAEVAYVGNYGRHVFSGNNPDDDFNTVSLEGFITPGCTATPCIPANLRRPFFAGGIVPNVLGVGGNFGWSGRVQSYFNEAHNWYKAMQARFTRRFSGWSAQVNYTLQRATNYDDDYWIYDPNLNKGPADFDRTHNFTAAVLYELPFGTGKKYGSNWTGVTESLLGGWQVNTNLFILSGSPFDVHYRNAGEDRDTGTGGLNDRPDLIGDPDGPQTRDQWFNAAPIGSSGSAFGRPAKGTFGNLGRNQLRGPGFWQVDLSLFKNISVGPGRRLEIRIESVNLFNHVNLGNPDSTIGVPGNDNPNAGRITGTAGNYNPRNFQFGFRFVF
jgi:Carboxypeptidase regulatory-like domain/TonB dependent receptor-like, beta-barrel